MSEITRPSMDSARLPEQSKRLMEVAHELEVSFLTEFLKYSEPSRENASFGGGVGEQQFGSFLRQEHARLMVQAGGIGLAEQLFNSLRVENEKP